MDAWRNVLVQPNTPILDVIQIIDSGGLQIAIVVDESSLLLGTVTDGDVRRGILRGIQFNEAVSQIMNTKPTIARPGDSRDSILAIMKLKRIHHIPVIDDIGKIVRIDTLDKLLQPETRKNRVVLMAGGLGSRLRPLTDDCPKPLLKVGDKPLLETIIGNFAEYGFRNFSISVNYKSNMIMEYFGDGKRFGVDISYLQETKPLGTAGALSLLPKDISDPLIVMNGDLLTKVNFVQLVDFHIQQKAVATMCVRDFNYQIPYGVVQIDGQKLKEIQEKPTQSCFVNAGIYVIEPDILDLIPHNEFFDMPSLFDKLHSLACETVVFPIREYWMDIGQRADFEKANIDFTEVFG